MGKLMQELARAHAENWCQAWNRRDLDAVMVHYADGVMFNSPTVVKRWGIASGWLEGKARLRENFGIGMQARNLHFELAEVLTGVDTMCVIYRRETGVLVTDLVELDADMRGVRVVACYGYHAG